MSLLIGPASGALVAGGIYYGFSNLIRSRTEQHQKDLAALRTRLVDTPSFVQASPPAAARISNHTFASTVKGTWNQEVENLFIGFRTWGEHVQDWGKGVSYGRLDDLPTPLEPQSLEPLS